MAQAARRLFPVFALLLAGGVAWLLLSGPQRQEFSWASSEPSVAVSDLEAEESREKEESAVGSGQPPAPPTAPTSSLLGRVFDVSRGPLGTRPFSGAAVELRFGPSELAGAFQGDQLGAIDHWEKQLSRSGKSGAEPREILPDPDRITRTDEEGRFLFEELPRDAWISCRVSAPGFLPENFSGIQLWNEDSRNLGRIDLEQGGAVTGSVIDEAGRPVAGAEVLLSGRLVARAEAYGRFRIDRVRSGVCTLSARRPGLLFSDAAEVPVTARSNEVTPGVVLTVPAADALLHGTVTDQEDQPVARARVSARRTGTEQSSLQRYHAVTSDDGAFSIPAVRPGEPFRIKAAAEGYEPKSIDVASAAEELAPIKLERWPSILLDIFDEESGEPVRPAFITARCDRSEERACPIALEDGYWRVMYAESCRPPFIVHAVGYESKWLTVRQEDEPLAVRLTPLRSLVGRVADPAGAPIAGARVRVLYRGESHSFTGSLLGLEALFDGADRASLGWNSSPRWGPIAVSDDEGRFSLGRLESDNALFVVDAQGFARMQKGRDEYRWKQAIEFVLLPAARLQGQVIGFDGEPAARYPLAVWCDRNSIHQTLTDTEGAYRFDDLPAGTCAVLAGPEVGPGSSRLRSDATILIQDIDREPARILLRNALEPRALVARGIALTAGEASVHDIDLRLLFGSVRGTVYVNEEGAEGLEVVLERTSGQQPCTFVERSAAGGSFRFPLLLPGIYRLNIHRDQMRLADETSVPLVIGQHRNLAVHCYLGSLTGTVRNSGPASFMLALARFKGDRPDAAAALSARPRIVARSGLDREGRFCFTDLPSGSYRITGGSADRYIADTTVQFDGSRAVDLVLTAEEGRTVRILTPNQARQRELSSSGSSRYEYREGRLWRANVILPNGDQCRPNATWLEESAILLEGVPLGSVSLRVDGYLGSRRRGSSRFWNNPMKRLELSITVLPDGPNEFTVGTDAWESIRETDRR